VLGNHDHHTDPAAITRALEGAGIPVLSNTATRLRRRGEPIWLVGTDDPATNHADLGRALARVPKGAFRLVLSHSPDVAWSFPEDGVDLALTGHTHGGQICLPGGQAIVASTSLGTDFAGGVFRWRGATLLVNRGLGVVSVPLRTFCPPEIAHLTLRRGSPATQ
jgi:predicted MPP superfamily phosphohydrolase